MRGLRNIAGGLLVNVRALVCLGHIGEHGGSEMAATALPLPASKLLVRALRLSYFVGVE